MPPKKAKRHGAPDNAPYILPKRNSPAREKEYWEVEGAPAITHAAKEKRPYWENYAPPPPKRNTPPRPKWEGIVPIPVPPAKKASPPKKMQLDIIEESPSKSSPTKKWLDEAVFVDRREESENWKNYLKDALSELFPQLLDAIFAEK